LISHDISVVKYLAEKVMVMNNGKIVEAGAVDDILASPKKNYTKTLLNSVFNLPQLELRS